MAYQNTQPIRWHYADLDDSNFQLRGHTLFFGLVLFSIILLVVLLILYGRWICRRGTNTSAAAAVGIVHAPPQPSQGLDLDSINSLPIILYLRPSENESGECSICLGIFGDGDKVKVLPNCKHCFHSECVDKWLITQSSCPLCRASLQIDSLV